MNPINSILLFSYPLSLSDLSPPAPSPIRAARQPVVTESPDVRQPWKKISLAGGGPRITTAPGPVGSVTNSTKIITAGIRQCLRHGLAGMAFMGQGNLPDRRQIRQDRGPGIGFRLIVRRETTATSPSNGSRMYEHAFSMLFLSEVYGMCPRPDIKQKLKKAAALIVQSQNPQGGWRYQPAPIDADISVTVSTCRPLRAARNVGIAVPKETIEKAIEYVKKSAKNDGSFNYQRMEYTEHRCATACGVVALQNSGEYDAPEVKRGLRIYFK